MDLNEHWRTSDGRSLALRAMSAADAPALGALFDCLGPDDRRRRFHGAVKGLPQAWLETLAGADQQRHVAVAATSPSAGGAEMIAEARWATDASGVAAELALVVAPAWRRRGIGECCLRALRRAAAQRGLDRLYGSVQVDNAPMIALARRCGFDCRPSRTDAALVIIESRIEPAAPAGPQRVVPLCFLL